MLPRVLEETGTRSSCAGTTRDREHPNVARFSGSTTCDSRRGRRKKKARKEQESSASVMSAASLV